ncbi:MAG: class I SAM-dependent methyltransferase [Candidatus Hermodarchaeota archaeon]
MVDPIQSQWEANSRAFADLIDQKGTPHHQHILNPCVEYLMGDVKGKILLDAGCGEGYLSRHYAQKGAIVTGVDISNGLIEICRSLPVNNVNYHVGDICDLDFIKNRKFDIVLCNLVLLNTPCLNEALNEFYRVLKPGGTLVFSVVHPSFNFYGPGKWEMGDRDIDTKRRKGLFFRVDRYFDEREYEHIWKTRTGEYFPQPISFFHRTLTTYIRAVIDSGFIISRIEEPRPVVDDDFFERERRIPFFLVVKARKPSTDST